MNEKTKHRGLTATEVEASRAKHGANIITPVAKQSVLVKLLEKFKDPLIIILMVACVLSFATSFYEYASLGESATVFIEPLGILFAVLLATILAFVFEYRADREFAILNKVSDEEPVTVIRDGHAHQIARSEVVVGDIVMLSVGQEIPADGILLEATRLSVDESTLTGEPMTHKQTEPQTDTESAYAANAVLRGTKVAEGHGVEQVTAVGDATEAGKMQQEVQIDNSVRTPLDEQLDDLSKKLTYLGIGIGAVIFVMRLAYFLLSDTDGVTWAELASYLLKTLMTSVAVICMAVPEGLPMAVTLSLAYSMRRMLATNNLVRKMHACETMGAATVICTDKTGTLTENRMSVRTAELNGADENVVDLSLAVNATAELDDTDATKVKIIGNPTEGALLLHLLSKGKDYRTLRQSVKVIAELPFSTMNKYMATAIETADGRRLMLMKGAPEVVCSHCTGQHSETLTTITALQAQALRVLGFAYRQLGDGETPDFSTGNMTEKDLTFIGYAAIADPVRADVADAFSECKTAGIGIKIVTGDADGVAREIGRQTGLLTDVSDAESVITGPEFAALSDEELTERAPKIKIISRARPLDKKRLVEALQRNGDVVAVTGDGSNDAPALKAAHVGLSMGDGTSMAKEASDITIIDNSFASISRAVLWGRSLFKNIQRFIMFQMTVNVSACLLMTVGIFMSKELPLTVLQILWVNLIMDTFAAMALASLPPDSRVMRDQPRDRKAFIISRPMGNHIGAVGGALTLVLLAVYYILLRYDVTRLADLVNLGTPTAAMELSPIEMGIFFNIFVMTHFWNMFNARAFETGASALRLQGCKGFISIAILIVVGQICISQLFPAMFGAEALSASDWILTLVCTSPVLWVGELLRKRK